MTRSPQQGGQGAYTNPGQQGDDAQGQGGHQGFEGPPEQAFEFARRKHRALHTQVEAEGKAKLSWSNASSRSS